MKAILISIKPKYVAKILNGEKTIEIRKTMPKCEFPIDVYIYCTKDKPYLHRHIEPFTHDKTYHLDNEKWYMANNGKVIAKFRLNKIERINAYDEPEQWYMTTSMGGRKLMEKSCLSFKELDDYLCGVYGYAWHISNLEIFDKPRELNEFNNCDKYPYTKYIGKAPQSWCYVEV